MPAIFTIIVNYNAGNALLDALRSVYASQSVKFEAVVVDNASTDGSLEAAKQKFSRAHFIASPENLGFAGGANLGIRFALEKGADAIFLLNPDAVIEPRTLASLAKTNEHCGRGVWSPRVLRPDGSVWFESGHIDWKRLRAVHAEAVGNTNVIDTEFVSGCAMYIDKEVFKTTGILDESFFLYYEDADFCVRAKKHGFPIRVARDISVIHHEMSEENKPRKTYWLVHSGKKFFEKHMPAHLKPWLYAFHAARKLKSAKRLHEYPHDPIAHSVYRGLRDLPYEH